MRKNKERMRRKMRRRKGARKSVMSTLVVFLGVAAFVCFARTQANALIIQPGPEGKDAWTDKNNRDANYGDDMELEASCTRSLGQAYAYIEFSGLPAGDILSADLWLYNTHQGTSSKKVVVRRVLENWDEGTITYNDSPLYGTPPDSSDVQMLDTGWYNWDITELVQGWIDGTYANQGVVVLGGQQYSKGVFHSSDYTGDPDLRPYLDITTIPEPASVLLLGAGLLGLAGFSRRRCRA